MQTTTKQLIIKILEKQAPGKLFLNMGTSPDSEKYTDVDGKFCRKSFFSFVNTFSFSLISAGYVPSALDAVPCLFFGDKYSTRLQQTFFEKSFSFLSR